MSSPVPTYPIGALWPWAPPEPLERPAQVPPVVSFETLESGCPEDATLRPRDREGVFSRCGRPSSRGRAVTEDEVPPYPLEGLNPWARRPVELG